MPENDNLLTNELQIDPISHAHLTETAKWAKFIAIAGFIFSGLILIMAFYIFSLVDNRSYAYRYQRQSELTTAAALFYMVIAIVWIVTSIYQLRFATKLQSALQSNYQEELQSCFQNFKIYYRLSGIVTIISLLFMILGIIGLMAKDS